MPQKKFTPRTPSGTPRKSRGSKSPNVIGIGGFGCVHSPAMKCQNIPAGFSYKNKISKYVRSGYSAMEEYNNYMKMKKLDPDGKYTLDAPILCNPRDDEKNRRAIDRCQITDTMSPKLLVMENGGISLDDLSKRVAFGMLDVDMIDVFREFDKAFEAIEYFNSRDFIHNDVKVHNILYNKDAPAGHKIKIIDFGISIPRSDYIEKLMNNSNGIYFAYPPEIAFTTEYHELKNLPTNRFLFNYEDKIDMHFSSLIKIIGIKDILEQYNLIAREVSRFLDFKEKTKKIDFTEDKYVIKIADTVDSYGLGVVLRTLAIKCAQSMDPNLQKKIYDLGYEMSHPNQFERMDLTSAHKIYRQILGITAPAAATVAVVAAVASPAAAQPSKCKTNYETIDGKCYKKCAANQQRNPTTRRCVRAAAAPTRRNKHSILKGCAANQEINPKTRRCVKKCAANQTRNAATGRCMKVRGGGNI